MGLINDILNEETGLSVRLKLKALINFYNSVVKSDSSFNVTRIDESFVKSTTPTTTKYLRDDGTWQTINVLQTLQQIVAVDPHVTDSIVGKGLTDGLIKYVLSPNDNVGGSFTLYSDSETPTIYFDGDLGLTIDNSLSNDELFSVDRVTDKVKILGFDVATQYWVNTNKKSLLNVGFYATNCLPSTLYYFSQQFVLGAPTNINSRTFNILSGTKITAFTMSFYCVVAVTGSVNNDVYLRDKTTNTDYLLLSHAANIATGSDVVFSNTSLNINIDNTHEYIIKYSTGVFTGSYNSLMGVGYLTIS